MYRMFHYDEKMVEVNKNVIDKNLFISLLVYMDHVIIDNYV